jgi:hypothetical protein
MLIQGRWVEGMSALKGPRRIVRRSKLVQMF